MEGNVMRFIGNEKKIKEITGNGNMDKGYGVGRLFSIDGEIEYAKGDDVKILDVKSYNFHLYPEDKDQRDNIKNAIDNKRKEIKDELGKLVKDKKEISIRSCAGSPHHEELKLFSYIKATKENIKYELNFMRFYIDVEENNKKVNCILEEIQFDRCIGDYVNKNKIDNKCDICYPMTRNPQSEQELKNILENCRKGKSFCYNPAVSFSDDAEKIAKKFIEFIDRCDEKKT